MKLTNSEAKQRSRDSVEMLRRESVSWGNQCRPIAIYQRIICFLINSLNQLRKAKAINN
jgi:hypothetical protein